MELTRDRDIFSEEASQLAKQVEEGKDVQKKLNGNLKDMEMKLVEERGKHQKTGERLKEKEKEVINKQESI